MAKRKTSSAPDELSGGALLAWDRFISDIDLEQIDRTAMTLLCQSWAEMMDAERHIETNGTVIKLPNGYPGPNPFCKTRNEARAVVLKLLREFGMTPMSRAKIGAAIEADEAELEF